MAIDLGSEFQKFDAAIKLTETQTNRIESARKALQSYLAAKFELSDTEVFVQGSYANGTAIKPLSGGEYDVDVIVVSAKGGDSADDALDQLEGALKDSGNYKDRIRKKRPCIRLEYADDYIGKFHVDVVPVRLSTSSDAPLDAPRRGDGWHGTNPSEYTAWCADRGENFRRTIRMLKRWRDEQQDVRHSVKSIVLQVLVAQCAPLSIENDSERIARTFIALNEQVKDRDVPPSLYNPVLPSENLTSRWDIDSFVDFKKAVASAAEVAQSVLDATDRSEVCESWQTVFGDAFPDEMTKGLSAMSIADLSHLEDFGKRGWYESLDPRYSIDVLCHEGRNARQMAPYKSGSKLLFAGKKLRFRAVVGGPTRVEVWWRVANTGKHARDRSALRGTFQKAQTLAKKPSSDQSIHWESTAFTGSHVVEAFALVGDRVVARSSQFEVRIHRAGVSWAW